ncbi:MAG: alpha/beta hydrolase family protein [Gemmatimonadota bacterium]
MRAVGVARAGAQVALCLTLLAGVPAILPAQDLAGSWIGIWIRDADTLDVRMRFENVDGAWKGAFDSDRLRLEGIPFTEVVFDPPVVRLRLVGDATTTEFEGRVLGDSLSGTMLENGPRGSFAFARSAETRPALREEEVRFRNGDVELAGTLILPSDTGPFPVVVFLHGSGPEARWPSRFLARRLANEGFAALIWDKRGVGDSGGDWQAASFEDQAQDVAAAVAFLRSRPEIDPERVGIHGHSQGGTIAPLAAVRSEADFVIGSAASGLPMADVEVYSIGNAIGVSSLPPDEAAIAKAYVDAIVDVAYRGAPREELVEAAARAEGHDWYFEPPGPEDFYWSFSRRIADFDPLSWWGRIRMPVLLVYGAEDERVPAEASREAIVRAIGDRAPVETHVFEGADHTFRIRRPEDVWPRTVEGYPDAILKWLAQIVTE